MPRRYPNPACQHGSHCRLTYHPQYWVVQQRKFMAERGTTLAGYIAFYAKLGDLDTDRITAIHQADVAKLRQYERDAAKV